MPNAGVRRLAVVLLFGTLCGPVTLTSDSAAAAATPTATHELLSLNLHHRPPHADSGTPQVSADGAHVTFISRAKGLLAGEVVPGRVAQAYLLTRATGETTLLSRGVRGRRGADRSWDAVSADGRFVAFSSAASNLTPEHARRSNIYLHDLQIGVTTLVSRAADGGVPGDSSYDPAVSDGGTAVTFQSAANDIVSGDTNELADVFVVDVAEGVTTWASQPSGPYPDRSHSLEPSITADGRSVVFATGKQLVAEDGNRVSDIYLWSAG